MSPSKTTTPDKIGGEIPVAPATVTDVTSPVSGAEGPMPRSMVVTVPDIIFGNPLAPEVMFPVVGNDPAPVPASENVDSGEPKEAALLAGLRLAGVRLQAGIEQGDDITVAQRIATTMDPQSIAHEIRTLSAVANASRRTAGRGEEASRHLVPRTAGTRAPSLGRHQEEAPSGISSTAAVSDDELWFV